MNLYDFVDSWLSSDERPDRYNADFTKQYMTDKLRVFSERCLDKHFLSDEHFKMAFNACGRFYAAKKSGAVESWKDFAGTDNLKGVEVGKASWEAASISEENRAELRDMVLKGVHIISQEQADKVFDSVDPRGKYTAPFSYALQIVEEAGQEPVFVAIDNSSDDAWIEEFKTLKGARAYLEGSSVEEIQEDIPGERPEKSLEELREEPIVGQVNLGGVLVTVDPKLTDVTYAEAVAYIQQLEQGLDRRNEHLTELKLYPAASKDDIAQDYTIKPIAFQRIRRITGYLVGNLDRWNGAKRAEEHDRVKHTSALGR